MTLISKSKAVPRVVRILFGVSLLACLRLSAGEGLPAYSTGYSAERDPFADGRAALALAKSSGRRVLIEVGGDWCAWCHRLERIISEHPEVATALYGNFVLLKVNVSDANPNDEFLSGLPKLAGYPKLFVARDDGVIVQSQDPSDFLAEGDYNPELILDFLQRWAIPAGGEK